MALRDDVRNLASVPALRDLEEDALRLIAFSAETRILRAGDVLFHRDDASDGGYVVMNGLIVMDDGESPTLVHPPGLIGATALVADTRRPGTALAREASTVLKISRALFHRVLSEYPDSAARLHRSLTVSVSGLRADLEVVRQGLLREI